VSQRAAVIAVVDDEECVCRAIKRLFNSAGFDVVTFTGGAAFLEYLEKGQVDCAVVDLHMPHLSGIDVQIKLTQTGRRVPVVIVTGHDTAESHRRVMDAGAVAYLRKPADDRALVDAVEMGINRYKSTGN
jgi:FixJ family two-component response regulator